jgi:hypothetical protein
MMYTDFERDFMRRTVELVRDYRGPFDATFLLNCLLGELRSPDTTSETLENPALGEVVSGLLIVPAERSLNAIPEDGVETLSKWGISPSCVKSFGRFRSRGPVNESVDAPKTLRRLVKALRNSIAHFRFAPISQAGEVVGFRFEELNGFEAEIPLPELREFVERLSVHLLQEFQREVQ